MAETTQERVAPAERPLRADARRNRARLLEAAEQVIAKQGVAAPIGDIAQCAGVGIGTVYRHFPTKQALFEAIVQSHFEPLIQRANELQDAEDPAAAFFGFIDYMVEAAGHKAVAYAIAEADPEVRRRRLEWSSQLQDGTSALLKRAQAVGAIRPGVSYEDVRVMLGSICMAHDRLETKRGQRKRSVALMRSALTAINAPLPGLPD